MLQKAPAPFADFVLGLSPEDIPSPVMARAEDLVLDLIGVSAAAQDLDASRIVREMAIRQLGAGPGTAPARLLFDNREASPAGAAWAGANQIDSLDAHDGYSPAKGHAGCGLLPGVLAFLEPDAELSGPDFLAAMVIGYEIASRAVPETGVGHPHSLALEQVESWLTYSCNFRNNQR